MKKNAGWRPLVALSLLCPGLAFGQPLPGAPDDLVNDAIPDDPYEIDGGAFLDGHPESPQVPFSVNTALVQFEDGTTVQQANDLLSGLGGELVGGISGEDGFAPATAIVRFPTSTHQEMDAVVAALQQDVTVLAAERDVALGEASLPRVTSPPSATTPADWVWDATPTGGNAGLEMMRVPSLWAFNDSVHKSGERTRVFEIDSGFSPHSDLAGVVNLAPLSSRHGTVVAGVIGANFGNNAFVDGVNPFVNLTVTSAPTAVSKVALGGLLLTLKAAMLVDPSIQVANFSLAYNWTGPRTPWETALALSNGLIFDRVLRTMEPDGPVVVCAAGNNGGFSAQLESPCNAAGLFWGNRSVVVVESIDRFGAHASFSSIGADVATVGVDVRTLDSGGTTRLWTGTSMSAAHVSGLVSYLYELDPSLPRPTHSSDPVADLVIATGTSGTGHAPVAHAFDAAMQIDVLRGDTLVLEALADFDDGTPDGNQRLTRAPGLTGSVDLTDEDVDGDGGPGDGVTDMSDFRRLRDALLLTSGTGTLDGSASHPKKDLNQNGLVAAPAHEGLEFPRADLNGDGKVDAFALRAVPGFPTPVTDLDVLTAVYSDPDYTASLLPGLLSSGDLEVWPTHCPGGTTMSVETKIIDASTGAVVEVRTTSAAMERQVFTRNPVQTGYRVEVSGRDVSGTVTSTKTTTWNPSVPGSDAFFAPFFCP